MCEEYNNKIIKLYKSFINDLVSVYPEQKNNLYSEYQQELTTDNYNVENSKINNLCLSLINIVSFGDVSERKIRSMLYVNT